MNKFERTFGDGYKGAPSSMKKDMLRRVEAGENPEVVREYYLKQGRKAMEAAKRPVGGKAPEVASGGAMPEAAPTPKLTTEEIIRIMSGQAGKSEETPADKPAGEREVPTSEPASDKEGTGEKTPLTEEADSEESPEFDNEESQVSQRDEALRIDEEFNDDEQEKAQRAIGIEVENILDGRSKEETLEYFDRNIEHVKQEIADLERKLQYSKGDEERRLGRWIAEAQADLASMERRRGLVSNYEPTDEANTELEQHDGEPLLEQAAGGVIDDLNPFPDELRPFLSEDDQRLLDLVENTDFVGRDQMFNQIVGRASAERARQEAAADAEVQRQEALDRFRRRASGDEHGLEGDNDEEADPDYVVTPKPRPEGVRDDDTVASVSELLENAEALRDEYERRLSQLDPNDPIRARFEAALEDQKKQVEGFRKRLEYAKEFADLETIEEAIPAGEKEATRINIWEKLKDRNAFKKIVRRAKAAVFAIIATATMLGGVATMMSQTAYAADSAQDTMASNSAAVELVDLTADQEQQASENDGGVSQEKALEELAEQLGVKIEDLEVDSNYEVAWNGVTYNYDEYYGYGDRNNKVSWNAFGMSREELYDAKDDNLTANEMYKIAYAQPEVLASFVADFPTLLEECGLSADLTAYEIDDIISNREDGGEIQKKLLAAFKRMLESDNVKFEYTLAQGTVGTPYMTVAEDETPAGHYLAMDEKTREDEPQVVLTYSVRSDDGTINEYTAHYNLRCGFQPNNYNEGEPTAITYTNEIPTPDQTPTPEPTAITYTNEIPTPDQTPTPEEPEKPPVTPPEEPVTPPEEPEEPEEPEKPPVTPPEEPVTPPGPLPEPEPEPIDPPIPPEPGPIPPEPKPTPLPPDPTPPPETEEVKNPEELEENSELGANGEVGETGAVEQEKPPQSPAPVETPEDNKDKTETEMQPDNTLTQEEQDQAHQEQENDNNNEIVEGPTGDALDDYINSLLNGDGN